MRAHISSFCVRGSCFVLEENNERDDCCPDIGHC